MATKYNAKTRRWEETDDITVEQQQSIKDVAKKLETGKMADLPVENSPLRLEFNRPEISLIDTNDSHVIILCQSEIDALRKIFVELGI